MLDLGPEGKVHMQIAAFDTDERADGKGKAPITWISKELLKNKRRWNPEYRGEGFIFKKPVMGTGAVGGWEHSELREALKKDILPLAPEPIRKRILIVKKEQEITYSERQTTHDILWIPSYNEVAGSAGVYAELLGDDKDRIKSIVGSSSASWWWLRSAYIIASIYSVGSDGSSTSYYADYSGGLALGFCT